MGGFVYSGVRRAKPQGRSGRPAAIEDVAAAAGVSIATVSRLINKPSLVAPETAARVYRAIDKLGYRPNPFAQGLMTRRSQLIGILLPDIHGEFYSELLRGADAEAHRRGYHLLVSSEARSEDGKALAPLFRLIDGLAVMITEPNEELWREVRGSGLPVVLLDTDPGPGQPDVQSIVVDNAAGAAEAARHLLESVRPQDCYFVGGPKTNFDTAQRAEAFVGALGAAGYAALPAQTAFGAYSYDWGYTWAQRMLQRSGIDQIGVLAGNDEIAFGLIRAFQEAGWPVPQRVRVIGFDDTRLASLLRPTLSTVRVPMAEIGAAAIGALLDRIERGSLPFPRARAEREASQPRPNRVRIPTTLVRRESSRG